jgi:hypothetical protein
MSLSRDVMARVRLAPQIKLVDAAVDALLSLAGRGA